MHIFLKQFPLFKKIVKLKCLMDLTGDNQPIYLSAIPPLQSDNSQYVLLGDKVRIDSSEANFNSRCGIHGSEFIVFIAFFTVVVAIAMIVFRVLLSVVFVLNALVTVAVSRHRRYEITWGVTIGWDPRSDNCVCARHAPIHFTSQK